MALVFEAQDDRRTTKTDIPEDEHPGAPYPKALPRWGGHLSKGPREPLLHHLGRTESQPHSATVFCISPTEGISSKEWSSGLDAEWRKGLGTLSDTKMASVSEDSKNWRWRTNRECHDGLPWILFILQPFNKLVCW